MQTTEELSAPVVRGKAACETGYVATVRLRRGLCGLAACARATHRAHALAVLTRGKSWRARLLAALSLGGRAAGGRSAVLALGGLRADFGQIRLTCRQLARQLLKLLRALRLAARGRAGSAQATRGNPKPILSAQLHQAVHQLPQLQASDFATQPRSVHGAQGRHEYTLRFALIAACMQARHVPRQTGRPLG
jgi:hypothetical protein